MGILVLFSTCVVGGPFGLLLTVLNYVSFAFIFYISGYAMGKISIYHSFLLGHVYALAWFVYWCLSEQFPQPQPLCSFTDPAALIAFRENGMPSLNALLNTTVVAFLIGKQVLSTEGGGLPPTLQAFILLLSPLWLTSDYLSRNYTIEQLAVGALVGILLAVYMLFVFHYAAREFYRALSFVPLLGAIFPKSMPSYPLKPEETDQDLIMLFSVDSTTSKQSFN